GTSRRAPALACVGARAEVVLAQFPRALRGMLWMEELIFDSSKATALWSGPQRVEYFLASRGELVLNEVLRIAGRRQSVAQTHDAPANRIEVEAHRDFDIGNRRARSALGDLAAFVLDSDDDLVVTAVERDLR